ncbi:MAG TPA: TolC family protein, partial [Polyangiales bacterium]|nr:TolC family protein [Polyangiales bacterium]
SVERRTQQHATIESMAKAGLRPSVDALRASVELLEARYLSERRVIEEQASFAALAAAVGRAPEVGLRAEPLPPDALAGPQGVAAVSDMARRQRPELGQLRELIQVEQESYDAAGARRWPTAGVYASGSAQYHHILAGEGINGPIYGSAAGIFLRWNAADPLIIRQRTVASRRVDEARRKLGEAELAVRREAVDAAYGEQRARALLEQTEQVLVAARATRTAQLERYQAGVASLLELLDAEELEQSARRARIEAARDHEIAKANVLAATGTLARLLE